MFECQTCMHRYRSALYANLLSLAPIRRSLTSRIAGREPNRIAAPWSRRNATALATQSKQSDPAYSILTGKKPDDFNIKSRNPERYALEQEMRYLGDPMKLADHTVNLLRKDQFEKVGELVKMASKRMSCTVSWNHMIDYDMSKGRVTRAMSSYNDMKKRGQQPDAHTFTIVLRGLAWHSDYGKSLQRALTVYHSMFSPNSPVKPTIIHTNAALKVCARAGDLDALWGVAARLPTSGPRASDKATFTTIFNAITRIVFDDGGRMTDESLKERMDRRQKAVLQGRRMWSEIIDRWKAGDLTLDEELVCAVGRLLLLADVPRDLDDILSLVEQTMGVPRQGRRLSEADRQRAPPEVDETATQMSNDDDNSLALSDQPENRPFAVANDDFVPGDEFQPIPSTNPMAYARPGQITLSLVIDACTRLRNISTAQDYWGLLTGPRYKITPDTDNYHMYLRLLRLQRASRQSLELVQEMRDGVGVGTSIPEAERRGNKGEAGGVQSKTFKIALGACRRDINNPNVMAHASKLVRMMIDCLPEVDVGVLSTYLEISVGAASHDWRAMSAALRGTELGVRGLKSRLLFGGKDPKGTPRYEERCREVYAFLNNLLGAYDKLLDGHRQQMLPEERKRCFEQKRIVATWQTELSRELGIVRGSRHHWGKEREEEGKKPEGRMMGGRLGRFGGRENRYGVGERRLALREDERGVSDAEEKEYEDEEYGDGGEDDKKAAFIREAQEARRKASKYTAGGANKRMAMAQYLRKMEEASM